MVGEGGRERRFGCRGGEGQTGDTNELWEGEIERDQHILNTLSVIP